MMFTSGATLILKPKFSASTFFSDVRKEGATVVQYIGEVCRYTLAQPPSPEDAKNSIRVAIGNGLRPDIWEQFRDRFAIPWIGEFYGSTEGPGGLLNTANKVGAVGFISPLVRGLAPMRIAKFDVEKEELVRDKKGFCVPCATGDVGEFLTKIDNIGGISNFAGYTNTEASKKKMAFDVTKKGDCWFRTGDLLKQDSQGFVYFMDRIGDTFRWKGENVSTLAVAEVMSSFPGCEQLTVYGVEVKGNDGRCGMAAIVGSDEKKIDWAALGKHVCKALPSYARPLFARMLKEMDLTGTFKYRKVDLQAAGYNPTVIREPIYFLNGDTYQRVDNKLYSDICEGKVRT
jgi:acyl-CoA synthetase (AMP-forming)/AMP-acid ligase II